LTDFFLGRSHNCDLTKFSVFEVWSDFFRFSARVIEKTNLKATEYLKCNHGHFLGRVRETHVLYFRLNFHSVIYVSTFISLSCTVRMNSNRNVHFDALRRSYKIYKVYFASRLLRIGTFITSCLTYCSLLQVNGEEDDKNARRTVSNPETESEMKAENGDLRRALEPRSSLTFVVKTDIDRIKAMTPEVITDRRKSLIFAAERRRSLITLDQTAGDPGHRKFSPPAHVFGRKLSCEAYSPHFSPLPLHGGTANTEDPHSKVNRILSLPATITDENEADTDSVSSKSINSTKN